MREPRAGVQSKRGRGKQDPPELLFHHVRPGGVSAGVATIQVYRQHGLPAFLGHVTHRGHVGNTSIVEKNINPSPFTDGTGHDFVAINHRIVVGNSGSIGANNFCDDGICHRAIIPLTIDTASQVVYDNFRTSACEFVCIGPADPVTGASNDNNTAFES